MAYLIGNNKFSFVVFFNLIAFSLFVVIIFWADYLFYKEVAKNILYFVKLAIFILGIFLQSFLTWRVYREVSYAETSYQVSAVAFGGFLTALCEQIYRSGFVAKRLKDFLSDVVPPTIPVNYTGYHVIFFLFASLLSLFWINKSAELVSASRKSDGARILLKSIFVCFFSYILLGIFLMFLFYGS